MRSAAAFSTSARAQLLTLLATMVVAAGGACCRAQSATEWQARRDRMVDTEIVAAGVLNERVIAAMRRTPRHDFVPIAMRDRAYFDMALPIGEEQTISPPFVVAYMTEQLDPQPTDRVLEIGTGSGYQAAVLSGLVSEVYTIEIVPALGRRAERTLKREGYDNVHVRVGDGYLGWPEAAPFDKIIVTCSPERAPEPLIEQLAEGGLMVVPVGERYQQNLYLMRKRDGQLERESLRATLFVPMTGEAEEKRRVLPDALRPTIENGSFEEQAGDTKMPVGWHYIRLGSIVEEANAPDGGAFLRFENDEPGRGCRALQGFAVDGRQVARLAVSFSVRGQDIRFGQNQQQWPYLVVTYYDEKRVQLESEVVGPFLGTFDWRREQRLIGVPARAREAIARIGLLGAVGRIDFDDIEVSAAPGR